MAPKRKSHSLPQKAKDSKKLHAVKVEDSFSFEDCDKKGTTMSGKNKNLTFTNIKMEKPSPELLEETQERESDEVLNLELNQLLEQNLMQGSYSWKVYLFPPVKKVAAFCKNAKHFLDLI